MNSNLTPSQALEVAREQPIVSRTRSRGRTSRTGSIEGVHVASERGEIIYIVDWDDTPCYAYRSERAETLTRVDTDSEEDADGTDAPSELWLSREDGDIHYVRVDLFSGTEDSGDSDDDRGQMCIAHKDGGLEVMERRAYTFVPGQYQHFVVGCSLSVEEPDAVLLTFDNMDTLCRAALRGADADPKENPCAEEPLTQRQEEWTYSDCRFAEQQGWLLTGRVCGEPEIQRLDDPRSAGCELEDPCFSSDYEAAGFVLDRAVNGVGQSKEVAQKALRLVSSETGLPEQPADMARCLVLSTAHLPRRYRVRPDVGALRVQAHRYGFIVFMAEAKDISSVPGWLRPIYQRALDTDALLIDFDVDAPVSEEFPTYDWT